MNAAPRRIPPSPFSGGVMLLLLKLDLQSLGEERRTDPVPAGIFRKRKHIFAKMIF